MSIHEALPDSPLSREVRSVFDQWIECIKNRDFGWMEENFESDFLLTAHPFPALVANREQFIEIDKKIDHIDVEFTNIWARQVGSIVLSQATLAVGQEKMTGDLGEGLPAGGEISEMLNGRTIIYASAWRRIDGRLKCFDHHIVGPVDI